jgi:hypothetical protein
MFSEFCGQSVLKLVEVAKYAIKENYRYTRMYRGGRMNLVYDDSAGSCRL